MQTKCDIKKESRALSTINTIINSGGTVEIFIGKNGLLVREVKKRMVFYPDRVNDKGQSED